MNDANNGNEAPETDWRRLLTPQERAAMLRDIARTCLAVGAALFPGESGQDLDLAAGPCAAPNSPVERLAFIERVLPDLTQAARHISSAPLTRSVTRTRPVAPPIRARRLGTQAILQAARQGPSARHWTETLSAQTGDTPENRAIISFLRVLEKDSAAIAQIASVWEEWQIQARAEACAEKLGRLRREALWERNPLWEDVTPDGAAWTAPPTQRAALRPDYARFYREMHRFRREFAFDWSLPLLSAPPREGWRLYETWCLLTVLKALMALGYGPVSQENFLILREGRLLWTLAPGEPSRLRLRGPDGSALSLCYNQTFAQGQQSLSRTMQPDITLSQESAQETVWILDAKFKPYALPGNEGGDINQMHAYRDAILGSRGQQIVSHAWCLFAGMADAPNRERITYGAAGGPVGALCLRPGSETAFPNLCALMTEWLRAAPPPSVLPVFPETASAPR